MSASTSRRLAELDRTIDWACRQIRGVNKLANVYGPKYRGQILSSIFSELNKARAEKKQLLKEVVQ
jgi:hypothetical protein